MYIHIYIYLYIYIYTHIYKIIQMSQLCLFVYFFDEFMVSPASFLQCRCTFGQAENMAVLWLKVAQHEAPLDELSPLAAEVVQGRRNWGTGGCVMQVSRSMWIYVYMYICICICILYIYIYYIYIFISISICKYYIYLYI